MKPSIYIDTNIFSVLHYRGSDVVLLAQKVATRSWWHLERREFRLYSSTWTAMELERGAYRAQALAMAEAKRLNFLPFSGRITQCSDAYLDAGVVPESSRGDAIQLAFAAIHMIDYLMSWDHAHLVREATQRRLEIVNARMKLMTPFLVTPLTIPKRSMGQEIRRRCEKE
jgi:predicted nucleic acid-binding protein